MPTASQEQLPELERTALQEQRFFFLTSLSEQLCRNSLESLSEQLCRSSLDSLIRQNSSKQLQSTSLDESSFERRAFICAALLSSKSCRTQLEHKQVQQLTQKSFQLTKVQLCQCLAQGGVQHKALYKTALRTRSWRRPLTRRSWSTRSSHTTSTTTTTKRTTRSLRRTLLSIVWFSFLLSNIFISSSFWEQEAAKNNELQETVWAQELEEQLAVKPFQKEQLQQQLQENTQAKSYQSEKLELQEPNAKLSFRSACSQQVPHNKPNNKALATELWENEVGMNLAEKAAWIIQLSNNQKDNTNTELEETQLEEHQEEGEAQHSFSAAWSSTASTTTIRYSSTSTTALSTRSSFNNYQTASKGIFVFSMSFRQQLGSSSQSNRHP